MTALDTTYQIRIAKPELARWADESKPWRGISKWIRQCVEDHRVLTAAIAPLIAAVNEGGALSKREAELVRLLLPIMTDPRRRR